MDGPLEKLYRSSGHRQHCCCLQCNATAGGLAGRNRLLQRCGSAINLWEDESSRHVVAIPCTTASVLGEALCGYLDIRWHEEQT